MLHFVGRNGDGWSSTITEINSYFLHLDSGGSSPNYYGYRAFGFPLRCLQE
ncbi:MAG: hypothetical protein K2K83_00495 [Rikenella sp.]|nr:hypothetical protein [Rikenella sp.]